MSSATFKLHADTIYLDPDARIMAEAAARGDYQRALVIDRPR